MPFSGTAKSPSEMADWVRTHMGAPVRGSSFMMAKLCMFESYVSYRTFWDKRSIPTLRSPFLTIETTRLPSGETFIPWTKAW